MKRILITNDDGILAPGLFHLWQALASHFEMYIIAPATDQSGVGLATTLRSPLHIEQVAWEKNTQAWKVNGTPADCIKLGMSVILEHKPDLIVSGINRGSNAGRTVLYSGTVGGVIEGVLRDIPGIAFSCFSYENPDFAKAASHVIPIVNHVIEQPLPRGTFLNINFPDHPEGIKGFKLAKQGRSYWLEDPSARRHPEGHPYYWLSGKWQTFDEDEASDVALLGRGYMTAVPIHVDQLTDHAFLNSRKAFFEKLHPGE